MREDCDAWKETWEDEPDSEIFKAYDEAYPFSTDGGGNYLALRRTEGTTHWPVYFVHHEADSIVGHGRLLAPDFLTFITVWSRLGCPGPDFDALEPFLADAGISAKSEPAQAWLGWLGWSDD